MADVLRDRLNQMAEDRKCNIASIRAEFEKRTARHGYVCPIPEGVRPFVIEV